MKIKLGSFFLFISILSIISNSFAQEGKNLLLSEDEKEYIQYISHHHKLNSPTEISRWLKNNIKYKTDLRAYDVPSYWQTPGETISLKTGDCEDFAFLAQALLSEIGISSLVIGIHFRKSTRSSSVPAYHAICVFPKDGPYYNYFNCAALYSVNKNSIIELVEIQYPSWYSIKEMDLLKHTREILFRK